MKRRRNRLAHLARPASIARVAEHAGVSIATVSRVLNGIANKASPETARRVRASAAKLSYRPMSVGRALRQRRSRLVAVLASNLANPTMAAIAASAESALRDRGQVMVLCDTHDRAELQDEYLLEMRAQLAQAIVLLGAIDSPQLRRLVAAGDNLVFVNRRCPFDPAQPFIGIDNREAGREVARLLRARDIDDIAVIHGPRSSSATEERIAGFTAEMRRQGARVAADRLLTDASADHLTIGYRAMDRLLRSGISPRAVFCLSDLMAYGAHRRASEHGLRVPEEMLLVGFDDGPLNDWVAPWLTSVTVPYEAFGQAIAAAIDPPSRAPIPPLAHRLNIRVR